MNVARLMQRPEVLALLSAGEGLSRGYRRNKDREEEQLQKERDYQQQYARQLGVMDYSQQQQEDAADKSWNRNAALASGSEGAMAAVGIDPSIAAPTAENYAIEQQRKVDEEQRRIADYESRGRLTEAQMKTQGLQQEEILRQRQREETRAAYELVIQDLISRGDFPTAKKNIEELGKENPTYALQLSKVIDTEEGLFKAQKKQDELTQRLDDWKEYALQSTSLEDLNERVGSAIGGDKRFKGIDTLKEFSGTVASFRALFPKDGDSNPRYNKDGSIEKTSRSQSLAERLQQKAQGERMQGDFGGIMGSVPANGRALPEDPADKYRMTQEGADPAFSSGVTRALPTAGAAQPLPATSGGPTAGIQPAISGATMAQPGIQPTALGASSGMPQGIDPNKWDPQKWAAIKQKYPTLSDSVLVETYNRVIR